MPEGLTLIGISNGQSSSEQVEQHSLEDVPDYQFTELNPSSGYYTCPLASRPLKQNF